MSNGYDAFPSLYDQSPEDDEDSGNEMKKDKKQASFMELMGLSSADGIFGEKPKDEKAQETVEDEPEETVEQATSQADVESTPASVEVSEPAVTPPSEQLEGDIEEEPEDINQSEQVNNVPEHEPEPAVEDIESQQEKADELMGELIVPHEEPEATPDVSQFESSNENEAPSIEESGIEQSPEDMSAEAPSEPEASNVSPDEEEPDTPEMPPTPPIESLRDDNESGEPEEPAYENVAPVTEMEPEKPERIEVRSGSGILPALIVDLLARRRDRKIRRQARKMDKRLSEVEGALEQESSNYPEIQRPASGEQPAFDKNAGISPAYAEVAPPERELEEKPIESIATINPETDEDEKEKKRLQALEYARLNEINREQSPEKYFDRRHEILDESTATEHASDGLASETGAGFGSSVPISQILAERSMNQASPPSSQKETVNGAAGSVNKEIYKKSIRTGSTVGIVLAVLAFITYLVLK